MISGNGRHFVLNETVEFVDGLNIGWRLNMSLAPWHEGSLRGLLEGQNLY